MNRNRRVGSPAAAQKVLSNPVVSGPKAAPAAKLQLGPGKVAPVAAAPANFQFVKLGNKVAPAWKSGPKKIWWGGGWKTFVPLTALGVVVLGGAYYYPDAYLTLARPYCAGVTPDGCRLNWQRIDFEDGDGEWQCVQYCRRRAGLPPPPRTVALIAPPPMAQGTCEMAIFSEPNFGGTNATATDEQPNSERERLAEPDRFGAGEVRDLGLLQRPAVHRRDDAAGARLLCRSRAAVDEAAPARSCACSRKSASVGNVLNLSEGSDPYGDALAVIIVSRCDSRLFMTCKRIVTDVEPLTQRTHP